MGRLLVTQNLLWKAFNDGDESDTRIQEFGNSQEYGSYVNSLICEDKLPVMVGHKQSGRSLRWLLPKDESHRLLLDAYRCFARDLLTEDSIKDFRGDVVMVSPETLRGEGPFLMMSVEAGRIGHDVVISNHWGKYVLNIERQKSPLKSALEKYNLLR